MTVSVESFAKIKRKHIVKEQLPEFVSNDHAVFVKFLEAYYEFLSEKQYVVSESLVDYLDVDSVPEDFLNYFWEEIKEIPGEIVVDKRLLAKHIRDLYASKGTKKSIELLFRILYNEDISIYEPKEDMLRASDGKWASVDIIRTKVPVGFDLFSLDGKKLHQYNQFGIELCQFIVANISLVQTDGIFLYIEITPTSLTGTVYSELQLYNSTKTIELSIVESFIIDQYRYRGSLYRSGDLFFTGEIPCYVETVGTGKVDDIFIMDPGIGYSVGDFLTINADGTGGAGLSAKVKTINGSGGVVSLDIINHGRGYETIPLISGNGSGKFVGYSSTSGKILSLSIKEPTSDNNPINPVTRAIVNSSTGLAEGDVLSLSTIRIRNENGLGLLTEAGDNFLSETSVSSIIVGTIYEIEDEYTITITDNFGPGQFITETGFAVLSESGSFINVETSNNPLEISTLSTQNGTTFNILYVNQCKIVSKMSPIFRVNSRYTNEDGFVSQSTKKLQDSKFYQDFSYVIKSSRSFENYKNILYKLIHPAGMKVFGEVNIETYISHLNGRIQYAFDELRIFSESLSYIQKSVETDFVHTTESLNSLGTTWEWLERYKFLLGDNYATGTYGAQAVGVAKFSRTVKAEDKNWKIADFSSVRFSDIYSYDKSFNVNHPLILDGSFILDGSEILSGVTATSTSSVGRYKLNPRRIQWAHGTEITLTPTFPISDIFTLSDSLSFSLSKVFSETFNMVENSGGISSVNKSTSETIGIVESASYMKSTLGSITETVNITDSIVKTFTKYEVNSMTVVDQITQIGTNAPKDTSTVTDSISWTINTASTLNSKTLNSGTL